MSNYNKKPSISDSGNKSNNSRVKLVEGPASTAAANKANASRAPQGPSKTSASFQEPLPCGQTRAPGRRDSLSQYEYGRRRRSYSLQWQPGVSIMPTRSVVMEPTYRLAPDETPSLTDIGRVAERLLSNLLHKQQYNGSEAATWVKIVSDRLKSEIKQLLPSNSRYKVISTVYIVEQSGQSAQISSRCLWETDIDFQVTRSYSNGSLLAVASVFCVYTP